MSDFIHIPITYPIPHSANHERDVVGCFLHNPATFDDFPHVTEDHFHLPDTRTIFKFAAEMRNKQNFEVTDIASLIEQINSRGLMERIGGTTGLRNMLERGSLPMHLAGHVEKLNHYLAKRLAIEAGKELVRSAFEDEINDMIECAGGPVTAIHDALTASMPILSTKRIIAESFAGYEERLAGSQSPMGIPTIHEIDIYLRGLHPGRVVVIGAYSGGGKSVLGSQIITECALDGHPVLEINYEMKERDSMDRKLIQVSRVPSAAFMDPKKYAADNNCLETNTGFLKNLTTAKNRLIEAPIRLVRPSNRQLRTLLAVIRKGVREMGAKVVSIDYLQLIRCKADSREGEVSEISHSLQELAQELGISILLLSQLNAEGDTKHGIVAIEDCDAYLIIQQERDKQADNFGQHYDILLAKDRHNGHGGKTIHLVFDSNLVRFVHGYIPRVKKSKTAPQKKPGH